MIGRQLAHYSITAHLGSGGMGDVYRAADRKLGRDVALKFLPAALAVDASRVDRFEREAKTLASLNHPGIATLYALEEAEGRSFLVMELVPGETLADRIHGKPLPWRVAVDIARQIAAALEAAHDKGVIHRDLKPANVKIMPGGQIKVLDFGLAKLVSDEGLAADRNQLANSPTLTAHGTHAGVILGTPAYMAPEQAMGQPVDRRADLFALGCVLYEMLTGTRAFYGGSVADILSRVLQRDPDWTRLPPDVPPALRRLLRLCLEKDPKRRRQSSSDVRVDLDNVLSEPAEPTPAVRPRGLRLGQLATLGVAIVAIAAFAALAVIHFREPAQPEIRLQLVTPPTRRPLDFALSPDGRNIVFVGSEQSAGSAGVDRLYLRPLDKDDAQPIAGTDGARLPFWSSDSRSIGFFAAGRMYRVDLAGGAPQPLAAAANPLGGSWNSGGVILFTPDSVSPVFQVLASGGPAVAATRLDAPRQTNHHHPSFLPDGRHFLFTASGSDPDDTGIYLGSLDGESAKRLSPAGSEAAYLAPDRIVFRQQSALVSRGFDGARGLLFGDPVTLATSVGAFSVSATGVVAHRAGGPTQLQTAWFDRKGNLGKTLPYAMNGPELSADDHQVTGDRTVDNNRDIWLLDLARNGVTRMTTHPAIDGYPLWSPNGSQLAFHSARKGTIDLWITPSIKAGVEELLLEQPDSEWPIHWSHDGRFLLYQRADLSRGTWDLWALPMTGANHTPIPVANTPFVERLGEFSPDGRWVVYDTNESGRSEIVAQSFPEPHERLPVSTGGGNGPRWSADGREVYFIALDGKMMAVPVRATPSKLEFGTPQALFDTQIFAQTFKQEYAVSRDGRFLITHIVESAAPPMAIILNAKSD